jgi:hypothetical protein
MNCLHRIWSGRHDGDDHDDDGNDDTVDVFLFIVHVYYKSQGSDFCFHRTWSASVVSDDDDYYISFLLKHNLDYSYHTVSHNISSSSRSSSCWSTYSHQHIFDCMNCCFVIIGQEIIAVILTSEIVQPNQVMIR